MDPVGASSSHHDEPPAAPPMHGGRRVALGVAAVAVFAVGVGFLLAKAAGFAQVLTAIRTADWAWFPLCLTAEVASYAGYVVCFRRVIVADGGPAIGPGTGTRIVLASLGASRIVSPAGAGGLVVVFWALRRLGVSPHSSAAKTLGLNIVLYAIWGGFGVAAAAILLVGLGSDVPPAVTLPWLVVVPLAFLAAAWVSAPSRGERLSRPPEHGWVRRGFAAAVSGVLVCRRILSRPRANRAALGGGALYWVGDIACLWAALRSVGVSVGILSVALAYVTAYPAMLLPLPTGGFGALDAAATFALTLLGIPLASAFVGVVVWRLFNFWIPTVPALVELARVRDLGRSLGRSAAPAVTPRAEPA